MKNNNSKTKDNNVYLRHIEQDDWNDIQAYHIENKIAWRNIAIITILALAFVCLYAMYMVNQDKHKTVVFEKDALGNITALGLATKTYNVDNKMVAHQIVNFITALREVSAEVSIRRRNIELVHSMIDPNIQTKIDQMIINQYRGAGTGEIIVKINQIKPLQGSNSWDINWSETVTNSGDANPEQTHNFSSTINFKLLDSIDPKVQVINPIGLFVTYIHPTQDINDKGV